MLDRRKTYVVIIEENEEMTGLAIQAEVRLKNKVDKYDCLCWYNFERGHMIFGRVKKETPTGIIFKSNNMGKIELREMTMEWFNERIRPSLYPEVSEIINDLDDVFTWYRQLAGMS